MPLNWSTTDRLAVSNGIKCLVYGPAGAGKTMLCASAPAPIIVSAENGLLSLNYANLVRVFGEERAKAVRSIPVLQVRNGLDLKDVYEWIKNSHEAKQFQTVCWDSSSETAEVMLMAGKAAKNDPRQAYGEVADIISDYFRKFRDLPEKNVVITAKMGSIKDGVNGNLYYGPDFPGKQLGPQSPYWLDEVFRIGVATATDTNTTYRFLQTDRDQMYDGKDRSGVLNFYEEADLTKIFAKITGGLS